jgi:hypothetical protein
VSEPLNASVTRGPIADLDRLAMTVTRPDGTVARWADDEPDVDKIPLDLQFSSGIPGGDADLGCGLLRDLSYSAPDLRNRNRVKVEGPGFEPVWRGYLAKSPRTKTMASPAATGEAGRLKGDPSLRMIPVDRDLSHWKPASGRRKQALIAANQPVKGDPEITPGQKGQSLTLSLRDTWVSPYLPVAEAWYDAGVGLRVRYVAAITEGDGNATFMLKVGWAPDDLPTTFKYTPDRYVTGGEWGALHDAVAEGFVASRFAWLNWQYPSTPAGAAGAVFQVMCRYLHVCGDEVPITVTTSGVWYWGVTGQDVIKAILQKAGNGITFDSTNSPSDPWTIPHLVWLEPVTAEQAILDTNRFFRRWWGVYDGKLKWAPPETFGNRFHVRRDEGADPQSGGNDSDSEINGVIVRYDDALTQEKGIVGPPSSGLVGSLNLSTAGLVVSDPQLPVNEWGERKWAIIEAGLTSEAGAIRIGELFREGAEQITASGTIEVGAWQIFDDTGARYPAWAIHAGDRLVEDDAPGQPERFVIQAQYGHSKRTATLTLDAPPNALEALQERLQVVLVGVVD